MGLRGPRPKHPEQARLDGNPGKRRLNLDVVEGNRAPFIPEHLSDDARGCIEVILQSLPSRMFSTADSFMLAAFATAWAEHKRAAHALADPAFQAVVKSARGAPQQNAWLRILNQQAQLMASLGDRLGLNPKARAALHRPAENMQDEFGGLLRLGALGRG